MTGYLILGPLVSKVVNILPTLPQSLPFKYFLSVCSVFLFHLIVPLLFGGHFISWQRSLFRFQCQATLTYYLTPYLPSHTTATNKLCLLIFSFYSSRCTHSLSLFLALFTCPYQTLYLYHTQSLMLQYVGTLFLSSFKSLHFIPLSLFLIHSQWKIAFTL